MCSFYFNLLRTESEEVEVETSLLKDIYENFMTFTKKQWSLTKQESNHQKHQEHAGYPTNTMPGKILYHAKWLKAEDCAKLKDYMSKWKKLSILLLYAFFIYLLEIPSILSLLFQGERVDTVEAMQCLNKTKDHLDLFDKKSFKKLLHVKKLV